MINNSYTFFLTHNCKKIFHRTLTNFFLDENRKHTTAVLFDDTSNQDIDYLQTIPNIVLYRAKNIVSSINVYDCAGGAHNFVLEYLSIKPELLNRYKYFWIIENDVYFNGNFIDFLTDYDYNHHCDLLVPEFGLRSSNWPWPKTVKGIPVNADIGISAPICRMSNRLASLLVYGIMNKIFAGFFESLLPNLCDYKNYSIRTFKPEDIGIFNTFKTKAIDVIEKDIINNTKTYIETKLYHPIKL